jgi:beta-glucosidase
LWLKVLDGDGQEHTRDTEEEKSLMRKIAGESITLLKNQDAALPLQAHGLKKIAIVGGNAKGLVLSGGGSAALKPSYFVSPYDGIVNALPKGIQVTYSEGARGQFIILNLSEFGSKHVAAFRVMPSLDFDIVTNTGQRGWVGTWYRHESDDSMTVVEEPVRTRVINETHILLDLSGPGDDITRRWTLRLRGQLVPREKDTVFEFGLIVAGRAKVCSPASTGVLLTTHPFFSSG